MQRNPARPAGGLGGWKYQRHQSEKTLLYQIIAQHYSTRQAEWGLIRGSDIHAWLCMPTPVKISLISPQSHY